MQPAIYTRVSSAEQVAGKCSLDVQRDECTKFCTSQGWDEPYYYSDPGWSGGNINRPGFQKMLSDIQGGIINVVLTYKVDRLSRNITDGLVIVRDDLIKNNIRYISIQDHIDISSDKVDDSIKLQMLLIVAEQERRNITERMSMGAIARAQHGYWHGGGTTPIGYNYNVVTHKLEINEQEAEQVRKIFSLLVDDGKNIHQIYKYMVEKGYRYDIGVHYKADRCKNYVTDTYSSHVTICNVLRNKLYAGYVTSTFGISDYKRRVAQAKRLGQDVDTIPKPETIEVKGVHPAIISEETYDKAQTELERVSWGATHKSNNPWASTHLLGGITWCKKCGARYSVQGCYSGKDRHRLYTYECKSRRFPELHGKCYGKIWRLELLEQQVVSDIVFLCSSQKRYQAQVAAQQGYARKINPSEFSDKISAYESQIDGLQRKYNRAVKMSLDTDDEDVAMSYAEQAQRISADIKDIKVKIDDARKTLTEIHTAPITYGDAHDLATDLQRIFESGDIEMSQKIIRKIIARIDIDDDDIYYTLKGTVAKKPDE